MKKLLALIACAALGGCAGATTQSSSAPMPALQSPSLGMTVDPAIAATMADISAARIRATDSSLVSFGTRHAMSDTLSATRGNGAARRWIHAQLEQTSRDCGGCLRVEYDTGTVVMERHPDKPSVMMVNVLAWLPGRDTTRVIVVGGHFDSCICNISRWDATNDAPGADDDGSGSSLVIELARVMSKHFPRGLDATVVFALYDGEEEGLYGSTHLAQRLQAQGYHVVAGITNDIVGNVTADDGRVDSTSVRMYSSDPDNAPSRELARFVWALGGAYHPALEIRPTFRRDRINRGGDHIPFTTPQTAGLRFTERLENYKRQHLPTDVFSEVNFNYTANIGRVNAMTVASLAAAPAAPDSATFVRDTGAGSGGQKWRLTWTPVPGAVGYEVLVRRTISPQYERVIAVGNVTSYLLDEQLDDAWAAVRSVDAAGHRSLTRAIPGGVPPTFSR